VSITLSEFQKLMNTGYFAKTDPESARDTLYHLIDRRNLMSWPTHAPDIIKNTIFEVLCEIIGLPFTPSYLNTDDTLKDITEKCGNDLKEVLNFVAIEHDPRKEAEKTVCDICNGKMEYKGF